MNTLSIFEIGMLLCFAFSWPVSIYKSLKTKFVLGKSPLFMIIVMLGYVFGIAHKIFFYNNAVIYLYILNFLIVGVDLFLYYYYLPKNKAALKNK